MTSLYRAVLGFLFDKIWGLISNGLKSLYQSYKSNKEEIKIEEKNTSQADVVQSVAEQIKALLKAGKPVPPELTERLKNEAHKLHAPVPVPYNGHF